MSAWAKYKKRLAIDKHSPVTDIARDLKLDHGIGFLVRLIEEKTIIVAFRQHIPSFARIALSSRYYVDPGSFGCLGVGVPLGIAAAPSECHDQVVVVNGDGSFGFNAIEIDTAVRFQARVVFVAVNNGAWQIETPDQTENYRRVVGTWLLRLRRNVRKPKDSNY